MKILIARTDRLGDVIMALPALDFLRQALPQSRLGFACAEPFKKMIAPFLRVRNIDWVTTENVAGYDAGLFLNTDSRLLFRAWRARMPIRVGALSRWPSFIWLNRGVRQKRSSAEKNEGAYSLDLAHRLVKELGYDDVYPADNPRLVLDSDADEAAAARAYLQDLGIPPGEKYLVLHPGTGGTAINVAAKDFVEIARELDAHSGMKVLLSQGPSLLDAELVQYVSANFKALPLIRGVGLEILREIFRGAVAVVGPSTGPLHLAHAVGTHAVGLFAPIRAQSPARWGFWGGAAKSTIFVPQVDCPGTSRCIGASCPEYFCMEKTPWSRLILEWANDLKRASGD